MVFTLLGFCIKVTDIQNKNNNAIKIMLSENVGMLGAGMYHAHHTRKHTHTAGDWCLCVPSIRPDTEEESMHFKHSNQHFQNKTTIIEYTEHKNRNKSMFNYTVVI